MSKERKRLVFGPVPSRRLGRSLGVDLIPFKTCNYDCRYCQLGSVGRTVVERREYEPVERVLGELEEALARGAEPDVITLSGSGEPTLHSGLGGVIRGIKARTRVPLTVLTNGGLLHLPEVRADLMAADIVVPNLDAGSAEVFAAINRPHPDLKFHEMVAGLQAFSREFGGKLLLEVFILAGVNDTEEEVRRIAEIAAGLGRARVQLNTVSRPPAEKDAKGVDRETLARFADLFEPAAEVIADFRSRRKLDPGRSVDPEALLEMVSRRPCTLDDLAAGLRADPARVGEAVDRLLAEGRIRPAPRGESVYFEPAR